MTKQKAIEHLEEAQDKLYDADQLIGNLRITKETAEVLHTIVSNIAEADTIISKVIVDLT